MENNFNTTLIMKTLITFLSAIIFVVLNECSQKKTEEKLFDITWELEYLSGPRIAFEGLFPDKKPQIIINKETMRVEGSNGCNGYSSDVTINGHSITFGEPGPTTLMYCGEGETIFLNTIKKVNHYNIDVDGKLNLMMDGLPMMRFKRTLE